MQSLIDVDQARALIIKHIRPLSHERVFLNQALDRILARDLYAPEDSPRFDTSAMDGYAVRLGDVEQANEQHPIALALAADIPAGKLPSIHLGPGQCARVMTGAVVPSGADVVIMREDCDESDPETIFIKAAPTEVGQHIRHRGCFMHKGQLLWRSGEGLDPGDLGVLASFGYATLEVFAKPRVAVISTGDELVELGKTPGPGQIVNSNAYMLDALLRRHGATPLIMPCVPDQPEALLNTYAQAIAQADMVISSGGASVGDHDHVTDVLTQLTEGLDLWKIRMKPGKPLVFGRAKAQGTPLIGLPGNPVSSFVCFHQFVRPALGALQGVPSTQLTMRRLNATLTRDVPSTSKRRHYITGRLLQHPQQGLRFDPIDHQDSGNLRILCQIDSLGIIEEGIDGLAAGATIEVELLDA